MRKKEIKIKAFSGDSSDKLFSFDKKEFEFIMATNAELAKMVTEKDHRIAVLERALANCVNRNIFLSENFLYKKYNIVLDFETEIDSYVHQAELEVGDERN